MREHSFGQTRACTRNLIQSLGALTLFLCVAVPSAHAQSSFELISALQSDDAQAAEVALTKLQAMNNPAILPILLGNIDSVIEPVKLKRLIQVAAPICDATCLPAISTALRHERREVVVEACRAAQKIAAGELRPALIHLLRNHPDAYVRYEAARALDASIHDDNFEELLAFVRPDEPDPASLHILRAVPASALEKLVNTYTTFVQNEILATSAIDPYIRHGQANLLFEQLAKTPPVDLPFKSRRQMLRALRRLAEAMHESVRGQLDDEGNALTLTLSPKNAEMLRNYARLTSNIEEIQELVLIMAPFEGMLPTILQLSYSEMDAFTPDVVASVMALLPESSARALIDNILLDDGLTSEPFGKKAIVDLATPSPATTLFFEMLMRYWSDDAVQLVLEATYAAHNEIVSIAVQVLEHAPYLSDEAFDRLQTLLGLHDVSEFAARALGRHAEWLSSFDDVEMLKRGARIDTFDRSYYLRWAMASSAALGGRPGQAIVDEALALVKTSPRSRHALPALALLIACKQKPELDAQFDVTKLARETQRLLFKAKLAAQLDVEPAIRQALHEPATQAEAIRYLVKHPDLAESFAGSIEWDSLLNAADPQVALRAMALIIVMAEKQAVSASDVRIALENSLFANDQRATHNALLALRALHVLPARETLNNLYARVTDVRSKNFIAMLTDTPSNREPTNEFVLKSVVRPRDLLNAPRDFTTYGKIYGGAFDSTDLSSIASRFGF